MRLKADSRGGTAYLSLRSDVDVVAISHNVVVVPPGATRADEHLVLDFDEGAPMADVSAGNHRASCLAVGGVRRW